MSATMSLKYIFKFCTRAQYGKETRWSCQWHYFCPLKTGKDKLMKKEKFQVWSFLWKISTVSCWWGQHLHLTRETLPGNCSTCYACLSNQNQASTEELLEEDHLKDACSPTLQVPIQNTYNMSIFLQFLESS